MMRSCSKSLVCLLLVAAAALARAQDAADDGATMKFRVTRPPGQGVRGVGFAADPGDAAWTLRVNEAGDVVIIHDGVEVVRSGHAFAVREGVAAYGRYAVARRSPQQVELTGSVPDLGLQWQGRAEPRSARELHLDLDVTAGRLLEGIAGGGLTWTLRRDAAALKDRANAPELLADRNGWRWPVGEGQEISVQFDRPVARVAFEPGRTDVIRTSFVGDRIRPGRGRIGLTVRLPEGGRIVAADSERYPRADSTWFRGALRWDLSPVDLSFLNAEDRPAGRRGPVRADGDRLVFADGTTARFWGTNLAGPVLFSTPPANIPGQARRMARLGYNLARIHQVDSGWVNPNIFGKDYRDTRHLASQALDLLDLWIKCLKDEGIYVWLDMHYLREVRSGDGVVLGRDEIDRQQHRYFGFNFLNPELINLMQEFQRQYLNHVNRYTGLAYKDDPAVVCVLITNENDLVGHFGNLFLRVKNNPAHQAIFDREVAAFARSSGLPADRLGKTWEPGPAKYLLNDLEHRYWRSMMDDLRTIGYKGPVVPTSFWGNTALYVLPALTVGDLIDAHAYGEAEALSANPHQVASFLCRAAGAQVQGKPLSITEWNVPYPALDRFTAPLYVASVACLQGWDAPMLYDYASVPLIPPGDTPAGRHIDKWSTFQDPALTGVMPAAALAFRRGHVRPARRTYCLNLSPGQLLGTAWIPEATPAIRTLVEQSRLTIGLPAVKELPWLKATELSGDVIAVADPGHDFLPPGATEVRSDTGELTRDWRRGVQTIDTPRTQAVHGGIGGQTLETKDATFQFKTRKAVVALSSVDDQPLASSRFLLITTIGTVRPTRQPVPNPAPGQEPGELPFFSEPVVGTIRLKNPTPGLELLTLGPDGRVLDRSAPTRDGDALTLRLPTPRGTHWYVLRTRQLPKPSDSRPVSPAP